MFVWPVLLSASHSNQELRDSGILFLECVIPLFISCACLDAFAATMRSW
jgi:hypothetical protein